MRKRKLLIHFITTIATITFIFLVQPYNLGFSPDSMFYLELAENLRAGHGLVLQNGFLETHWPPLYSAMLAGLSFLTEIPVLEVGIYFNSLCLYGFLIAFYYILEELRLNFKLSVCLTLVLLVSYPTRVFAHYLSEGFFLFLLLLSFLFLLKWMKRDQSKYLYLSGIFCGIMYLTRYAGLGFIGAYFLFLLLHQGNFKAKAKRIISFAFCIGLVLLPWFLFKLNYEGEQRIRNYYFEIISVEKIKEFFITIGYWFIGSVITRIVLPILVLVNIYFFRNKFGSLFAVPTIAYRQHQNSIHLLLLLIFTYISFLVLSIIFYTSRIPLDNRLLAPIFPFILILTGFILKELNASSEKRLAFYSLTFILFLNFTAISAPQWLHQYNYGAGYSKKSWKESEILSLLKEQKEDLKIYTNGTEIIKLHSLFPSEPIPMKENSVKLEKIRKEIKANNAQIIFFNNINWRNYYTSEEEISKVFKEFNRLEMGDGFIIKGSPAAHTYIKW